MGEILNKAIVFATNVHSGQFRKSTDIPYILHPLEEAAIVGTMTTDDEILAAAVLHDVVEDTDTTVERVRELFGDRTALRSRPGLGFDSPPDCHSLPRPFDPVFIYKNKNDPQRGSFLFGRGTRDRTQDTRFWRRKVEGRKVLCLLGFLGFRWLVPQTLPQYCR
ncbi:MAG: bifunctional (p)ppGpp synthetase/guanosine-3',5'-bis(diphosphate) 3'-pyrophosphohydrolase [Clostridia bacterium]|nr:bifunctional (p)ppGpp synthetase/guanosine-3',5'-bis(diphosphate) 3'-pyrophosphohydrolase [Clostridia bacterium]